ncbi:hypothetical protein [Saccharothrix saharensis]|uniref:hypothetical protein n=1 Tax=Saccharothrix saharensis TaxID=571190 RepID=UPI001151F609|nr:hypothetical protein [Saccharothrix saharensis]
MRCTSGRRRRRRAACAVGPRSAAEAGKGAQLDQIPGDDGVAAITFDREPPSAWSDVLAQWRQAGGDRVADEPAEEHAAVR